MALFGAGGARMGGFGGGATPSMKLQDIRRVKQQRNFFQPAPPKQPDESLDYFVDPSVTGATTYTNQPPAPSTNSNAYRLQQMRSATPRLTTMTRRTPFYSGY